jgi:hypothetical protein
MIAGTFPSACTGAFAQFSGYFSGYYAQAQWTTFVSRNPLYQTTAFVYSGTPPQSVEITRTASSASGEAQSQLFIGSACLLRQSLTHRNQAAGIETSKES